jgi:hypothetical protein
MLAQVLVLGLKVVVSIHESELAATRRPICRSKIISQIANLFLYDFEFRQNDLKHFYLSGKSIHVLDLGVEDWHPLLPI